MAFDKVIELKLCLLFETTHQKLSEVMEKYKYSILGA
jgi:hypothetical protein